VSAPYVKLTGARTRHFRTQHPGPVYEYVRRFAVNAWLEAVKAFTVGMANAVHVDTGMSGATIFPLAGYVKYQWAIRSMITSQVKSPPKPDHIDYARYGLPDAHSGPFKSMTRGERIGAKSFRVTTGKKSRVILQFRYTLTAAQHVFNEANWKSANAAMSEFNAAFDQAMQTFNPHGVLSDYIASGRLPFEVTGGGFVIGDYDE
jgi:hypothetical protein